MVEAEQGTLLNLNTKELDPYWVDPSQKLLIPVNPLHYAAHKYQVILDRLEVQAQKNPAQFNSGNYIAIVEKLEKLWEKINNADTTTSGDDEGLLGQNGNNPATPPMGDRNTAGMGVRVSADNPTAG